MAILTLVGNLTKDLEARESNGKRFFLARVAENRKSGSVDITDYYSCFIPLGTIPEGLVKYLVKGSRVQVTGSYTSSLYQGDNGPKIDRTLNVWNVALLNSKLEGAGGEGEGGGGA